jgi:hypothetical protein
MLQDTSIELLNGMVIHITDEALLVRRVLCWD